MDQGKHVIGRSVAGIRLQRLAHFLQRHRTREKNREDAIGRLRDLVAAAAYVAPVRRATRPTRSSQLRRVEGKVKRGQVKAMRGKVVE